MASFSTTNLSGGVVRLVLYRRPTARQLLLSGLGGVALAALGVVLLRAGACVVGLVLAAIGVGMARAVWRRLVRGERWELSPGTARRLGEPQELTLVHRVRVEKEPDVTPTLVRVTLLHGAGATPVGEPRPVNEDTAKLVELLGAALGTPTDALPK